MWGNWALYLDFDNSTRNFPTLAEFERKSGYTVEYREDIDDNYSFNGKVQPILANGQDIGYDVVCPSDFLVAEWIRKGYLAPLDKANIPNPANVLPELDPSLVDDPWVFPTDELLAQAQVFRLLSPEEQAEYTDLFGRVTQA